MKLAVLLCRDCCCGTDRKHPDVDHAAQEEALRAAARTSGSKVIRTRCLGVCERSNVVVVKTGSQTLWFGETLTPERTREVVEFVRLGGDAPAPVAFDVVARRARSTAP